MPKAEGAAVLGTLRTGARARTIATEGPIELVIRGPLAAGRWPLGWRARRRVGRGPIWSTFGPSRRAFVSCGVR
jgi:hypothetical protein